MAQHGVLTLAQLTALGLGARAVQKRAAAGRLHRIYRGVYSVLPTPLLTRNGRFMAAVLACGPGAALSHRSAAALHELRPTDRAGIDVTAPGRRRRRLPGVVVHGSNTLIASDVTLVNGIPCTTIARTLLDLAGVVSRRVLERAVDQAEILEALDAAALEAQLEANRHCAAAAALRAVLKEHQAGATATRSELEERFLVVCRAAGVPEPEVNAWLAPADGEPAILVDFLWRPQRLIFEADGHATHRTSRAFESDRRRDQRLTRAGWRVVRVTWRQLGADGAAVTARLIADLLGDG